MLGYLVADSVGFDNPDAKSSLLVAGRYNGNGCYIRKDDYLNKLLCSVQVDISLIIENGQKEQGL